MDNHKRYWSLHYEVNMDSVLALNCKVQYLSWGVLKRFENFNKESCLQLGDSSFGEYGGCDFKTQCLSLITLR